MLPKNFSKISLVLGVVPVLLGALGLIGWLAGTRALFAFSPGLPLLAFIAALALVVLGTGFVCLETGHRRSARWFGGALLLLGGFAMLQYTLQRNFGIEPLLLPARLHLRPGETGTMSMLAAMTCIMLGMALVLAGARPLYSGALVILASMVAAAATLTLCAYALRLDMRSGWGPLTGLSPLAAVGFLSGALALLGWVRRQVAKHERSSVDGLAAFSLAAVSMMGVGVAAWNSNQLQADSSDLVSHTYEVIESMNYVELCLTRMESAARGYALGQQESYLDYYNDIEKRLVTETHWLSKLVADNPAEVARAGELRQLANAKRAFMRDVLGQIKTGKLELKPESFRQPTGPDLMAAIRAKVNEMETVERKLLADREAETDRNSELTGRVIISGEVFAALLALVALYFTRRADLARQAAQEELRVANESLEQRVRDRTAELQQAIDQLVDRERSRRFLADTIPQLVWTAAADGGAESFNRSWCDYSGLTEQQSKSDGWLQVLHPDDVAETMRLWRQTMTSQREGGGQYRLRRADDGTYRWMLWRARPELDLDGRLVRWVGTSTDIHDQKAAAAVLEERVRERTTELDRVTRLQRAVLDGTVFSVIATDPTGLIAEFNHGAEKMLGYRRDEMVGRQTPAIFHDAGEVGARAAELTRELGREIAPGFEVFVAHARLGRVEEREWTYVRKDGGRRPVRLSVTALHDEGGDITGFLGIAYDLTEQQRAAEEIARSTRLVHTVTDGLPGMVGYWDRELRCTFANRSYQEWFGRTPEQMQGVEMRALLGEPLFRLNEPYARGALAGKPQSFERVLTKANGETGHTWAQYVPDFAADGVTVNGFVVLVSDITEVKKKDEALRTSELRLRDAQRIARLGNWEFDPRARDKEWWSDELYTLFGYDPGSITITSELFYGHVHPADRTGLRAAVDQALATRGRYSHEFRIRQADGAERSMHDDGQALCDADGHLLLMRGVMQDITERKQAEAALRESEARLQNVFRSMAEGLMLHDAEGRITECNAAAERITGVTREQMLGLTTLGLRWRTIKKDGSDFRVEEYPSSVTRLTGQSQRDVVIGVHKPDGSLTWVSVNSEAIFNAEGKVQAVVVSFIDVSERKQLLDNLAVARDQALEASRLKSEFLASMSHEIRTPMNGIIGMSGLLMETDLTPEQQEMGLVVQNSAESLLTIINDILDFSKIEAGKLRIEPADFELQPLVEETLALLAPRAHEKNLELLCDLDPQLHLTLRGDAGRVRQVLLNLAGNAIKFTEKGEVVVAAKCLRGSAERAVLRIEVTDTGIGIPAAAQRQLFQPFVQADGSTTRRFGGTGLGLAISRQLVELMGGEIGFQSAEGTGSTFWFQLDLQKRPAVPAAPLPPLAPGRRVLVVDDNASNRRILTGQLKIFGLESEAVASASAALESLRAAAARGAPYDLALLDWHMPEVDGLGLAVEIRADPALAETPLIMLSSSTVQADTPTVEAVRFAALLTKPVRESQLHRTLLRVLGGSPPRAAAAGKSAATPATPPLHSALRLLVAEDNPTNQLVVRRFLERLGHSIDFADNGEEALVQLARKPYDAVLMDCQMPVMDGYTATKRIRSGELPGVNARIPVIALTAYAMPSDRLKCLAAGMDEYVAKPLRVAELAEALRRCGLHSDRPDLGELPSAAPAAQPSLSDLLDPRQVEQLRSLPGQAGGSLLRDLIRLFLDEMPGTLARLGDQLERRAGDELVMSAHKLAGACANLGATELQAAALAIETAGRAGHWPELPARLAQADREWMRLRHHLENFPPEATS